MGCKNERINLSEIKFEVNIMYANQKSIQISKELCSSKNNYAKINLDALQNAMVTLSKMGSIKLWLYLSKNQDGYRFNLSCSECAKYGLKPDAYHSAVKDLQEKGFLQKLSDNFYVFKEYPYEKKISSIEATNNIESGIEENCENQKIIIDKSLEDMLYWLRDRNVWLHSFQSENVLRYAMAFGEVAQFIYQNFFGIDSRTVNNKQDWLHLDVDKLMKETDELFSPLNSIQLDLQNGNAMKSTKNNIHIKVSFFKRGIYVGENIFDSLSFFKRSFKIKDSLLKKIRCEHDGKGIIHDEGLYGLGCCDCDCKNDFIKTKKSFYVVEFIDNIFTIPSPSSNGDKNNCINMNNLPEEMNSEDYFNLLINYERKISNDCK